MLGRSAAHALDSIHIQGLEYTHHSADGDEMRTNIVIDDRLMEKAMRAAGLSTKRAAVEAGLHLVIRVQGHSGMRRSRGEEEGEGDLPKMRAGAVGRPSCS